ncbi:uncharacterized protein BHQ10_009511 [Talaromyces amestolkiae]|uniref:Transcription factor domain-containing protein n=1 Tax=Talaromyces amestolkiae TaxID=1196081 RepID=A0A364LCJ7_TALAM|nr:uncharacterized protein BHQ10_009511 [Talaromyces amestolkiae]RAO73499.1 hypothetical protein BHQ10_009511 [Talaromyces amestolkiae]
MAVEHRGKALKYLSSALASPSHPNRTELDLILATTYALTFQASYMIDGLIDFAVMVRGCSIVTRYILAQYQCSEMFKLLMPNDIYAYVWPLLSAEPSHSPEMIDACIETLEAIQPLLQGDIPRHLTYNAILSTYQAMKVSAQQAFLTFTFIYSSWDHINDHDFIKFLNPGDPVSSLLLIHFIAATIMMRPIFEVLRVDIVSTPKDALANHHWGIHRYESLPAKFRGLVEWQVSLINADKAWIESGLKLHAMGSRATI